MTEEQLDIEPTEELRIAALAAFLEEDPEDISATSYDETLFDVPGAEYLVLTDEEADAKTKENIGESLWAFNAWFVAQYTPDGVDQEVIEILQQAKYEDSNDAIATMVGDNFDELVDDAISADGRGHFLGQYDGNEGELEVDGIYWFFYRTN